MLFKKRNAPISLDQDAHPYSDLPLVLASGVGRSGTTMLRKCLAAHPAINCFDHEANYVYDLMRAAKLNLDDKNRAQSLPITTASYWQLQQQLILRTFWPADSKTKPGENNALATYSMMDREAAIGLRKTFAKLAVCLIVRNGIEVVSSYISHPPFQHMNFKQVCRLWHLRNDMFKYCENQEHVFLLRYEWLLTDRPRFEKQLEAAMNFIGLELDPQCVRPLDKNSRGSKYEGEPADAGRDLTKRKERWRYWTPEQLKTFEEVCGDTMEYQGYEIPWA